MTWKKPRVLASIAMLSTAIVLTSCAPAITINTVTPQVEIPTGIPPIQTSISILEIKTPVSLDMTATIESVSVPDPRVFDRGSILVNLNPGLGIVYPGSDTIETLSTDCVYQVNDAFPGRAAILLGKNSGELCISYNHVFYDLGLYSITPQDLSLTEITSLTPNFDMVTEGTLYSEILSEAFYASTAISWTAPAWSPDGRYLAFVGAIKGSSSNLYIYDSLDDAIEWRSIDANHAMEIFWAPNSTGVLFTEYEFNANPFDVFVHLPVALWWVSVEDERSIEFSRMEDPIFWGWITDTRFMIWNTTPGGRIAIGDVSTGRTQYLLETVERAVTLYSADGGGVLAAVDNENYDLDVFLINGDTGRITQVDLTIADTYVDIRAVPALNRFLIADIYNGLVWITTDGQVMTIDGDVSPSELTLSPDGLKVVAWGSQMNDVRLYEFDSDGRLLGKFSISAWNDTWLEPIWHPLSNSLLLDCDSQEATYALPDSWESYQFTNTGGCPHWKNTVAILWLNN